MNTSTSDMEMFEDDKFLLHRIKFFILIGLQIPAIAIILLIFAFFVTHRTALKNLQHQAVLILLIVDFIELSIDSSMRAHFYYLGYVSPATSTYCTWWTFLDYTLSLTNILLMTTISIQRHTLIFKSHILQVRSKRYILYYLPLSLCFIYPVIFYMAVVVFYPCDGTLWDFTSSLCGYANCYLINNAKLGTYDWIADTALPILVIWIANVALIVRFNKQKRRHQQPFVWKKQRRMIRQMLSITSLFGIAWLPSIIVGLLQQFISSKFLYEIQVDYTAEVVYLACLLLPWVCLGLLPEFTKWIRKYWRCGIAVHNIITPA